MTNITALPNRRAADTWRYLDELGYSVDPLTGEAYGPEPEHPDVTRIRRENLRLTQRNPPATYRPDGPSAA